MSNLRSRAVTAIRMLSIVTLALYAVVVALLALTVMFPTWGIIPHAAYLLYFPPQFFAAAYIALVAFGLAALAGVIAAVRSGTALRAGWAGGIWVLTGLAVQGPLFVAVIVYGHAGMAPDPTAEATSVIASALAFLLLPVVALVATRDARSAGRGPARKRSPPVGDPTPPVGDPAAGRPYAVASAQASLGRVTS